MRVPDCIINSDAERYTEGFSARAIACLARAALIVGTVSPMRPSFVAHAQADEKRTIRKTVVGCACPVVTAEYFQNDPLRDGGIDVFRGA